MPGLLGFAGDLPMAPTLLNKMATALRDYPDYATDLYQQTDWGLGQVGLRFRHSAPQPIWNGDHTVALGMTGQVYADAGAALFDQTCAAEYVLDTYAKFGEDFAAHLNGAFSLAIWDGRAHQLILASDRLGLCPLYYARLGTAMLFASGVRALQACPGLSPCVDQVALTQLLTFDHLLGERTLLTQASLLMPASVLTWCDGVLRTRRYWELQYAHPYQAHTEKDYFEQLIHLLRQAIARQTPRDVPTGILLSGGVDSRVVLGLLSENQHTPVHTFTFGIPGCDDLKFAREVSARSHSHHHAFELAPDYLVRFAEQGVRLTDGMSNCIHLHALANLERVTEHAQLVFKGFLGDTLMGYFSHRLFLTQYDDESLMQIFWARYPIVFTDDELRECLADEIYQATQGQAADACRASLLEARGALAGDCFNYFDLAQRQRRHTLGGVELVRSRALVGSPFWDRDLVDFMLTVPPGLRLDRYLIKCVLIALFPELAKVPCTEDGYPILSGFRDLFMRLDNHIRWRFRALGLKDFPVYQPRPYADYAPWMRTSLREWMQDILLSQTTRARGYFKPAAIQKLVDDHLAGADHSSKLGLLLAFELWQRQGQASPS